MPLAKEKGLLALIWDVYTNQKKANQFKRDPDAFMDKYGLEKAELQAVWATGINPKLPANRKAALAIKKSGKAGANDVEYLADRKKPDKKSIGKLCALLVAHLGDPKAFEDAW